MNSPGKYLSIIAVIIVVTSLLLGVLSNTHLLNVSSDSNSNNKKQEYSDFTYMDEDYRISFRNKNHDYKIVRVDDQTFAICDKNGTPLVTSCQFISEKPLPITTLENKHSLNVARNVQEARFTIKLFTDKTGSYYPDTRFMLISFSGNYDMIYCETDLSLAELNNIADVLFIY